LAVLANKKPIPVKSIGINTTIEILSIRDQINGGVDVEHLLSGRVIRVDG